MTQESINALDAVNIAIQMERDGHKFYHEAAARIEDDNGKEIFAKLANDELAHLYWLMTVRQSLVRTGQFGEVEALLKEDQPIDHNVFEGFPAMAHSLEIEPGSRELDAFQMGIQAEKDAVAFYLRAAETTHDLGGRSLFKRLAEWEEEHVRILETERDYLENNGVCLGLAEFHLEGPEYMRWWRR
ncbi:MAG: ferritin family protein [Chloroflexi bacterium]|nr:ferritin family protein [Chloroflexota bacterium]